MKKINIFLILFMAALLAAVGSLRAQCSIEHRIDSLLPYIAEVESLCHIYAVGDNGKAFGLYQLHPIFVRDYNRIFGGNYSHADAFCPYTAAHITKSVLMHYSMKYYAMTCRMPSARVILAIHNGGWRGWENEATVPYLGKFGIE